VPFIKNTIASPLPDDELVQAYKSTRDLIFLSELYQRYMDLVYGVCLKYLKDPENAKDSVLLIFEELITKLQKHEVSHFKGWLYQLSRNHCLMILRSEKKMMRSQMDVSLMQSVENVHLNGELEKEENFKHMYFCLSQLVPEQKKVLELFYLEEKCYNEIVDATGIEWNKVRSFIQNGRRNLKICMEKQIADH
jgi:RNA polymerase sigma-70 factor (ECF subfamily)